MGMYRHLQKTWQSEEMKQIMKERMISWRRHEPVILRIERPTRLDRAHALGYKAKQGFVMARVRIKKGTRKREKPSGGRKPGKQGMTSIPPKMNLQHIAEMRTARKFPNCEVIGSYYLAEDGRQIWYEVIMVDPNHPAIKSTKSLKWLQNPSNRRRVFRGKTSAGRSSRGLRGHGKGYEKRLK
ncbi:MAG: 50S ribosomal protein L15e [Candidatus Aenigmatarchaeota archaeon]